MSLRSLIFWLKKSKKKINSWLEFIIGGTRAGKSRVAELRARCAFLDYPQKCKKLLLITDSWFSCYSMTLSIQDKAGL